MSAAKRPRRSIILLAVLLALLFLSSCGGSPSATPSSPQGSGVQGKALIVGGPPPGSPRPQSGVTVAVHKGQRDGAVVAKAPAASDGSFKFDLPPGTYTLIEVSDAAVPRTVVVQPGQYAAVTLYIQAK